VAASILWKLASWRFRVLGIAQPLHQGLFPGKDEFFEQTEATAEVSPDAITDKAQPMPLATPVDEHTQPDLRGTVMVEEKPEEGKSGD
jgi:hypothetical protein